MDFIDQLSRVSHEIYTIETKIQEATAAILTAELVVSDLESSIEMEIANGEFKNDQQRKAYRLSRLSEPESIKHKHAVTQSKQERETLTILHSKLLRDFSTLKLAVRLEAARIEASAK